jgi:pyruvate kinase
MTATMTEPAVNAIVTVPPYASFVEEVAAHPIVSGLRLNTVMPVKGELRGVLERLAAAARGKTLYVDLKGRQLRVVGAAIPPFTELRVSHRVRLDTPADAWLADGRERARVVAVDGDRLILEDGPRRLVGPGESINIPSRSLEVEGTLTDSDRAYIAAARDLGLHDIMLSFVERPEDVEEVRALDPRARVVCKIESARGLAFAAAHGARLGRLMAARGDLYVEVGAPHEIVAATRAIVAADPGAIVASRLFPSLARGPVPEAQDISDAALLLELGYRTFMLGDEVCLRRDSAVAALNLLEAVAAAARPAAATRAPRRASAELRRPACGTYSRADGE